MPSCDSESGSESDSSLEGISVGVVQGPGCVLPIRCEGTGFNSKEFTTFFGPVPSTN